MRHHLFTGGTPGLPVAGSYTDAAFVATGPGRVRTGRRTGELGAFPTYCRWASPQTFTPPFTVEGRMLIRSRLDTVWIEHENRAPTWDWRLCFLAFRDEDNNVVATVGGKDQPSTPGLTYQRNKLYGSNDPQWPGWERLERTAMSVPMGRWVPFGFDVDERRYRLHIDGRVVVDGTFRQPVIAAPVRVGFRFDFHDVELDAVYVDDHEGDAVQRHATYLPRVNVHSDRYGARRDSRPTLMVLHTSEQSNEAQALALAQYMEQPGDRPNGRGGYYGSSYHGVTETNRRIYPCVPDDVVAYSAGGGNHQGVHLCIPGKAAQSRAQWLDAISDEYLWSAACWLVDKSREHGIPLVRLSVDEVRAGESGYCSHHDISLAFGKSTHTDPGPNFPWDVVHERIVSLITPTPRPPQPPEDDDVKLYAATDEAGTVWVGNGVHRSRVPSNATLDVHILRSANGTGPQLVNLDGKAVATRQDVQGKKHPQHVIDTLGAVV